MTCRLSRAGWIGGAAIIATVVAAPAGLAQHEPPHGGGDAEHDQHDAEAEQPDHMMEPGPLGVPRTRDASGTSWLPDASPMNALHWSVGPWSLMFHANVFVQYIDEGGDRGEAEAGSIHWLMLMATGSVAGGELGLRAMVSLEPLTVGECGYPDLLATGETCRGGEPIVDQQHPHDLFMELGAMYSRAVADRLAVQIYGALSGEPALGPVAYPHRTSSLPSPIAPITHHWLDSTHIAFGVVTAGIFGRRWKLESSVFNGREPDEQRDDLDLAPLDSVSARLWWLPTERWSLQVSAGHLEEAELELGTDERVDLNRYTAAAIYHRPFARDRLWASTLAWGMNDEDGEELTHALLAESSLQIGQNTGFGRIELVEKPAGDLDLPDLGDETFTVGKLQLSYVRDFGPFASLVPGLGASALISYVPGEIESAYGTRVPVGFALFARLRPAAMGAR